MIAAEYRLMIRAFAVSYRVESIAPPQAGVGIEVRGLVVEAPADADADFQIAGNAGMTTDEFSKTVTDWLPMAKHPTAGKPFTSMAWANE